MVDAQIFISSCSRRQLARRRPARAAVRIELVILVLLLLTASGAVLAARGGL